MQAFYPLKIQAIRSKGQQARLYVSMSIFPCPWRPQSACKPAKKFSGNCWIAANYTCYENSYLSSKPLKGYPKGGQTPMPAPQKQTVKNKRRPKAT
jgi:hypothetical protein